MSPPAKKPAKKPMSTPKQRQRAKEQAFKPLATEIGWIAFEWNRLQAALAELFSDALNVSDVHETKTSIGFNVWHSVRSDLTQREMLKAAASSREVTATPERRPVWTAIEGLVDKITSISHRRNDALHVPLIFVATHEGYEVETLAFFGSPQAKKLSDKDLLTEFEWYRKSLAVLADHAETLHCTIIDPEHFSLQPIPALPTLGQKASPKRSPRRKSSK
jgi:hypothetical protein